MVLAAVSTIECKYLPPGFGKPRVLRDSRRWERQKKIEAMGQMLCLFPMEKKMDIWDPDNKNGPKFYPFARKDEGLFFFCFICQDLRDQLFSAR